MGNQTLARAMHNALHYNLDEDMYHRYKVVVRHGKLAFDGKMVA